MLLHYLVKPENHNCCLFQWNLCIWDLLA